MIRNYFLLVISFAGLHLPGFSQVKKEKSIVRAVEQLRIAMLNADSAQLEKLADDKLSYGHSGGQVDNKKEFIQKLLSGRSDFVTLNFSESTIHRSGRIAVVRHTLYGKTNDNGVPGEVHLKILLIWQKKKGGWKLLARQAVKTG